MTEGERWTRELLGDLKEAHFRPWAWRCMLARSFARAREQRAERPRARRELVVVAGASAAVWAGAAVALDSWLALGVAWSLAVAQMIDWHLGLLETPSGRALDRLGLANALTLFRALLIPALFAVPVRWVALVLAVAAASDVLDGQLARRRGVTRFGFWADGIADGVLVAAAALALAIGGALPAWSAALVGARFAVPWCSSALAFARAKVPGPGHFVHARLPGVLLLAGLALAALGAPGAPVIVAVGAVGNLAAHAATLLRFWRRPSVSGRSGRSLDRAAVTVPAGHGGRPLGPPAERATSRSPRR